MVCLVHTERPGGVGRHVYVGVATHRHIAIGGGNLNTGWMHTHVHM